MIESKSLSEVSSCMLDLESFESRSEGFGSDCVEAYS